MGKEAKNTKVVRPSTVKYSRISQHSDGQCGCGSRWSPSCLQYLRHPLLIVCFICLVGVVTYANNSYFGATLSTIERRFGLSNSQSAFLAAVNDLSSTLVVVFISFLADRTSRPLWLLFSILCIAVGNIMTALPHFLSEPLNTEALLTGRRSTSASNTSWSGDVCTMGVEIDSTSTNSSTCMEESVGFRGLIWWAVVGQIVLGAGQAAFTPVVIPYLDDLAGRNRRRFVIYYSIYCTVWIGGPALGFFLGSSSLAYYVDFERIPKEEIPTGIPQRDPRWIGAWWIGFVAMAFYMLLLALPMPFLPRDPSVNVCITHQKVSEGETLDMPKTGVKRPSGISDLPVQNQEDKWQKSGFLTTAKAFLPSVKRILRRPVLVLYMCFMVLELASIGVFTSFTVKYFQFQFNVAPKRAAFLNGAVLAPAAILGLNVSAFVCRRFKLTLKQCGKYTIFNSTLTTVILIVGMFIGCQNPTVAGVNQTYPTITTSLDNSSCNSNCECNENIFRPVCGSGGISYLSPCHAGCQTEEKSNNSSFPIGYTDCACTKRSVTEVNFRHVLSEAEEVYATPVFSTGEQFGSATPGLCEREKNCGNNLIYLVLIFGALAFCRFQDNAPMNLIVLGHSENEIRTTVYGVSGFFNNIFGFFPTPIYFGAIVNTTCALWQYTCGERAACWLYDIDKLRYAYFGISIALRVIQIPVCIGITLSVKESLKKENDDGDSEPNPEAHKSY